MNLTFDNIALWGNIVLVHLWGAVFYLKPGLLPILAGIVQIVVLCAMFIERLKK